MDNLFQKISAYVEKYHMLSPDDVVVTGVSGGADSVCLLLVLSALQKEIPFRMLVVHVNHMIRSDAGRDAAFVEELCKRTGVPFYPVEENVELLAQTEGISTEEAGRQARYAAFFEVLEKEAPDACKNGRGKIAVAHNLNDRAETMLFNLFRGSGLAGLCSIRPVRKEKDGSVIIRPLLSCSRAEIEDFLKGHGMAWCMDSTNAEDTYTRNRIRHHILPFAEEQIASGAVANMGRAADILSETEDFVREETEKAYAGCTVKQEGRIITEVEAFLTCHPLLQKRILLQILEEMTPARKDLTAAHIESLLSLFTKGANREICLPYGIRARREYSRVLFSKESIQKKKEGLESEDFFCRITVPGPGEDAVPVLLPDGSVMEFKVFNYEKTINIPQNQYTKWFDYDKIEKSLEIRTRKTGDYLTVDGAFSRKNIQDYMVNEKIPREERNRILLLVQKQHVLWVPGYRISTYYKINENTNYVLQVQLRGGHQNVGACKNTFDREGSR